MMVPWVPFAIIIGLVVILSLLVIAVVVTGDIKSSYERDHPDE
jgi:hypothetical protein